MKVLHITPTTNGYEEVNLIANRVSRKNSLALIEKNGQQSMTGGIIIEDLPTNREILDSIPREDQYRTMLNLRQVPYVKLYSDG